MAERGCWDALPYCGSYEELDAIFASEKPDEVVVALPTEEGRWMGRIINACEKDGTKLSVVPSYVRYMPANPSSTASTACRSSTCAVFRWTIWATPSSNGRRISSALWYSSF